jgi:predicted ArsR family transcriptional regulator
MHHDPELPTGKPSADGGNGRRGHSTAYGNGSSPGGNAAAGFDDPANLVPIAPIANPGPFEHATDAQMIYRRVGTVSPLVTPSPGPGASSTLRREVLYAIRTGGPASPDQIAERVGASRTGVLQQLRTLESAALVSRSLSRHGVGRPRHVYDLTPSAQELFPANYGALAQSILLAIRAVGGEQLIEEVFSARRQLLKARITRRLQERLPDNASLWDRVREVAGFQDETGYLGRAVRDPDGTIRLCEHNCAIYGVSGSYPIACEAELSLFGEVLGATVTRECLIVAGARSCTYRIEPPQQ